MSQISHAKLPWYYVYSPRYTAFHYMMQDCIRDSRFELRPIFVEQSVFKKAYNPAAGHFMCGCYIKLEKILELLKTLPLYSYFLLTDNDVIVIKNEGLFEYLQVFMDKGVDMAFMRERVGEFQVNVGFQLFKVCPRVIRFFEEVIEITRSSNTSETDKMDEQSIVVSLLPKFPGTIEIFDNTRIVLSNMFNETNPKENINAVHLLCGNHKDFRMNMYEKYMGIKALGAPVEQYIRRAIQDGIHPDELGVTIS
jgi:hypothetical protein